MIKIIVIVHLFSDVYPRIFTKKHLKTISWLLQFHDDILSLSSLLRMPITVCFHGQLLVAVCAFINLPE